jgi:3-oxoacyl-[acyl-carrier protein] reductase
MLKGKTVVITGAARGIGKTVALTMAENGADIAVMDLPQNEAAARETAEGARACGINAQVFLGDVSDFEQTKTVCDEIIKTFKKLDILVNNAGITRDGLLLSMSEADFDAVIRVNLKGTFNVTRHLTRYLIKSPAGRVINIASVVGITGNAGQANYAASKAGVIGLTKTAAKELAGRGVTCNAIAPGFIDTDMTAVLPDNVKEKMLAGIPLKRFGGVKEVANLALFLASENASYITGEVIKVDGGMCI